MGCTRLLTVYAKSRGGFITAPICFMNFGKLPAENLKKGLEKLKKSYYNKLRREGKRCGLV